MHERAGHHARPQGAAPASGTAAQFTLIDTGGIDLDPDPIAGSIRDQARAALADAAVALLVVDAAAGLRPGDEEIADLLRRAGMPVSSPPTRSTGRATRRSPPSSTRLGLGEPMPVSAAQGLGTGDLLDRIVELLPDADEARRGRRRRPPGADRPPERRQVLPGERPRSARSA